MMTTLIALFTLFASTFGVFIGLYEDSRDKIWAYVAARALLLAVSYGAAIAVFWFAPTAWWLLWRMAAMWATFYALAKVSFHFVCQSQLNRTRLRFRQPEKGKTHFQAAYSALLFNPPHPKRQKTCTPQPNSSP